MKLFLLLFIFERAVASVTLQPASSLRELGDGSATVNLGYAVYRGTRLSAGVDQYLGMRYAAPPLADRRFRAPIDPVHEEGIQDASTLGPLCIGVGQKISAELNEDCLFVNIFTPSKATPNSNLPIWVYIQGGGYAQNANGNYNGTEVVKKSGYNLILVNFNYRVGALGFLAAKEVQKNGDLNVGLLDQRKLLRWVQRHIRKFGGDPNQVVIHGASAGAGSVAHHLTAYGGRDEKLFKGAIAESSFWPMVLTVDETEFQFDLFLNDTGCSGPRPMDCLRSRDLSIIQGGNIVHCHPGANQGPLPLWYWLPVIDGGIVPGRFYDTFVAGRFLHLPLFIATDTNEGSFFAPNASSPAQVSMFLKSLWPNLDNEQLNIINDAYPLEPPVPLHNIYFPSASAAMGDSFFTCPGYQMFEAQAGFLPSNAWLYRFKFIDPSLEAAGLGTPHTVETPAIFGLESTSWPLTIAPSYTTTNAAIVPIVMNYYISFVRALNPNTFRSYDAPYWESWGRGRQILRLQTNMTAMEDVSPKLIDRCQLWRDLAPETSN